MIHRKILPDLSNLDWSRAQVVVEPEGYRPGFWVGAADVINDPRDGCFYLYYRIRRPIDPADPLQRGSRCRIARSEDGVHFEDVWELNASELDTVSIEKGCFDLTRDGRARLYLSYECPEGKGWQVDLLEGPTFDALDVGARRTVLHPRDLPGAWHVKDPVVLQQDDRLLLYANVHEPERGPGETTHLATSPDGVEFTWQGRVLDTGDGWDAFTSRITDLVVAPPFFVLFYDGAASHVHLYEEEAGVAVGLAPDAFVKVTTNGPLFRKGPRRDVPYPDGPWLASVDSVRYVIAVPHDGGLLVYAEHTNEDGSHDIRVHPIGLAV